MSNLFSPSVLGNSHAVSLKDRERERRCVWRHLAHPLPSLSTKQPVARAICITSSVRALIGCCPLLVEDEKSQNSRSRFPARIPERAVAHAQIDLGVGLPHWSPSVLITKAHYCFERTSTIQGACAMDRAYDCISLNFNKLSLSLVFCSA